MVGGFSLPDCGPRPMTDDDLDHIPIEQRPAKTLMDVARTVTLQPLEPLDLRYVDPSPGLDTLELGQLRRAARKLAVAGGYGKIVLSGHKGCGKTTELKRLERDLTDVFTPVHLEIDLDSSLKEDFDYSLFLLWLTEGLVAFFADLECPLPAKEVESIGDWFAERTETKLDKDEIRASLEFNAEAKARFGFAGVGFGVLSRLKSQVMGSSEKRLEIKRRLRNFPHELLDRVNQLLLTAREILRRKGKPQRLLIVQDNLDRLSQGASVDFFLDNGDLLKRLNVDVIFTAPVGVTLAPRKIADVFEANFMMPTIKVASMDGAPFDEGLKVLRQAVAHRVAPELFAAPKLIDQLIRLSGGSVRDLMRLLDNAAELAETLEQTLITERAVMEAEKKLRRGFNDALMKNAAAYYPFLAGVHKTKKPETGEGQPPEILSDLLKNASILAYDNGEPWYDVHPVVQTMSQFKAAWAKVVANE